MWQIPVDDLDISADVVAHVVPRHKHYHAVLNRYVAVTALHRVAVPISGPRAGCPPLVCNNTASPSGTQSPLKARNNLDEQVATSEIAGRKKLMLRQV